MNDLEFKVNKYILLKLEGKFTEIYVNGKRFNVCKRLVIVIPETYIESYERIESIDEASDLYNHYLIENEQYQEENGSLYPSLYSYDITPEVEFWGHCSNIQAWVEHDYDTRILHSNLAFPLLKELTKAGDPKAKEKFKEEIAKRFLNGLFQTKYFLYREGYLDYLNENEFKCLIDEYYDRLKSFDSLEGRTKEYSLFLILTLERIKREDMDYIIKEIYYSLQEKCGFDEFEFWFQIGTWAKRKIKRKLAILSFKRSLKLNPKDIATLYQLGCLFKDKYKYRKAIKMFKRALKIDPFHYDILYALGSLYYEISRCNKAIKVINRALEFYSNNPELYYLLGEVYEEKGEYRAALEKYMEALNKNNIDPFLLDSIANVYKKLKNYEWAVVTYKTILFFYPNSSLALDGLCEILIEKGELNEAIKFSKRAIRCDKWNRSNWIRLGKIYYSKGTYEEAIELYKKALEIFPDDTEILFHLRLAYVKVGRNDLAFCTLVFEEFISTFRH